MKLIRGLDNLTSLPTSVVSIGNFDGVHTAHQFIIKQLIAKAQEHNSPSVVISFYPHPSAFFGYPTTLISGLREKYQLLKDLGVDVLLLIQFNAEFAKQSAEEFIADILQQKLNAQFVVIGDDFRFGKGKTGDGALIHNFIPTQTIPPQEEENMRISSSRIRKLLANASIADANMLLGYEFFISGRVVAGKKIGRELGFRTANINTHNRLLPLKGVFSACIVVKGVSYNGVVNIGTKPTVHHSNRTSVEAHIFDFNENIYNYNITIIIKEKLRDEQKFSSVEELRMQIKKDILLAKTKV